MHIFSKSRIYMNANKSLGEPVYLRTFIKIYAKSQPQNITVINWDYTPSKIHSFRSFFSLSQHILLLHSFIPAVLPSHPNLKFLKLFFFPQAEKGIRHLYNYFMFKKLFTKTGELLDVALEKKKISSIGKINQWHSHTYFLHSFSTISIPNTESFCKSKN